ncbi:response regulator transcription factor [Scytonema sp. UIC 10036]|uniref:response regulator n=1 Tax=Scytonema sp. UIC 10036 TaxID=2304196 RepID=UPI001FAA2210|nr:response regulator transcription factor [Scytonema sp. UIC 10036]
MKQVISNKTLLNILAIDDHESVLSGTIDILQKQYPEARFSTALTSKNALDQVTRLNPDVVVMDLSIPDSPGMLPRPEASVQLLKTLMKGFPTLNLVVQSAHGSFRKNWKLLASVRNSVLAHILQLQTTNSINLCS